jgi:hypothetical protein
VREDELGHTGAGGGAGGVLDGGVVVDDVLEAGDGHEPCVASTTSLIPGGPKTAGDAGSLLMTQCVVMTSFRSVR